MKTSFHLLSLATITTLVSAIVVPEAEVLAQIQLEPSSRSYGNGNGVCDAKLTTTTNKDPLEAFNDKHCHHRNDNDNDDKFTDEKALGFNFEAWVNQGSDPVNLEWPHPHPPKDPHHPHHPGKPGKHHGHHGPHHHLNMTIYEAISKSNYTKILAKYIDDDKDLVHLLNSTKANYTLFAPTDWAFKRIPKDCKPSKELIKKVLQYHVAPGSLPSFKLAWLHTVPTLLEPDSLGGFPQRIKASLYPILGLRVNHRKVVAANMKATNGIIHGLSNFLIPPPRITTILSALPDYFSKFELALSKTRLVDAYNSTGAAGKTVFAPTNFAFMKLGPRTQAFLFSKWGEKYLKALLKYHISPNTTLYSTAIYESKAPEGAALFSDKEDARMRQRFHQDADNDEDSRAGFFKRMRKSLWGDRHHHDGKDHHHHHPHLSHVNLPTLLEGHDLSVDLMRFGIFVGAKVNGIIRVASLDGIADDGVLHVVRSVLIPPKRKPSADGEVYGYDNGYGDDENREISVEELMERLIPFVEESYEEEEMPENIEF